MASGDQDDEQLGTDSKGRHAPLREDEVERAFDAIVARGRPRLFRTVAELLASGVIAGVEISLGVLAFLAVEQATGSELLAGLAFGVGFIALLLGNSELFTEGFLVPIAVVLAREAGWWRLLRFWAITLAGNLFGGWLSMWMVVVAFPELGSVAVETGRTFAESGYTLHTFLLAVLAGSAMTLLTRMRIGTSDDVARVLASLTTAFLVAGLSMYHSVLDTLFLFGGIHAGAGYGYGTWVVFFGWTALGNAVGGIGLTSFLRLVRSHERLNEWRRAAPASRRP
ncbi:MULTISPECIES: formate/nitrite transporter family protein [unclassified Actinopolyspora]|uniref:formate/nitrite transporter family protein n=1 Tax=unclassified Actinopolyspora TaxID=2639451 RepID=UPI0013F5DE49|nr:MULTISPECIES: formate/nitrite transporter family protein [unclassified Actinopolyspora]NHD18149.1 formate/nitrite transporter family protein [Actinopolyspora sp. BKK2]NHE77174.1 formate/nitrite transporter family protein [Actinopolyspora sp. BKK1]